MKMINKDFGYLCDDEKAFSMMPSTAREWVLTVFFSVITATLFYVFSFFFFLLE
ncbi:hypothetical protein [Oligella sp. MSHR50489EDL]|uniref:hypothetical protein n=1 Tax=Oligella sp. MSHR50489EDL TaxID=3139409 RepID=UPI003D817B2D